MKLINCPINGLREASEFAFGGEVKPMPAMDCTDAQWAEYVFYENNTEAVVQEWWLHVPSGYWFIAERNRSTDTIERTLKPEDLFTRELLAGEASD